MQPVRRAGERLERADQGVRQKLRRDVPADGQSGDQRRRRVRSVRVHEGGEEGLRAGGAPRERRQVELREVPRGQAGQGGEQVRAHREPASHRGRHQENPLRVFGIFFSSRKNFI